MNALSASSRSAIVGPEPTSSDRARAQARTKRRVLVNGLRIGVAVLVLGLWELGTSQGEAGLIDPFFYGRPSGIASQLWNWIQNGTAQGPLWLQVATTLEEAALGFLIGVALGVVFGVALAVVLVFFVVFFNAFQGVREVDRVLLANARILGASERQLSTHVIFPSALSWILASLHTSFGFALVGAVVGEYLGAIHGIGLVIATAQATFNPNGVFAAMFILAIVALTAEFAMTWLENRLIKWRPNTATDMAYI